MPDPIASMLPARWEYRKVTQRYLSNERADDRAEKRKQLDELNTLGADGWELAAAVPVTGFEQSTSEILYVFKRRAD